MRVLILGASNSILKNGFALGLRRALPQATFVNMSVGASPGLQYAGWCAKDLSAFDFVVFDSLTNDEYVTWFEEQPAYYARILFEMFSTIAAQTRLMVVAFCSRRHFDAPSIFYRIQEETAHKVGATFLSGCDFARQHRAVFADVLPDYIDDQHLNPLIAHEFGQAAGWRMALGAKGPSAAQNFAANFSTVELGQTHGGLAVRRGNRRVQEDFVYLRRGDVVAFDGPRRPVGFYVDVKNTSGFLQFRGGGATLNLALHFEIDPAKLQLRFIPLRPGLVVESLAAIEDCDDWETARGAFERRQTEQTQICISRIVCWDPR